MGITPSGALTRFESTGEPFAGSTDADTAGNGSIMRLAPVPVAYAHDPSVAMYLAGESSRTTHGAPNCVAACRYLGGLIVGAMNGADKATLLSERFSPVANAWLDHPLTTAVDEVAGGSFQRKQPPEIEGTGYVVASLEAALWAFHSTTSFEEGALAAVNLGDDADTTGAVFGQLAGAYYGVDGIPARWLEPLAMRAEIERLADELAALRPQ